MNSASPLPVDVVSDVVCRWCYIGKALLEKAIALKPDVAVDVRFHPFFLNPWVPREGMSRQEYLIAKFGSVERYNANNSRVVEAAASLGLPYAREKILRQPNTLDCHRLIHWAAASGNAAPMKQRLMELYFAEGGDLTDREVLVAAAGRCGMDGAQVRDLLASDADVEEVTRAADFAKEAGIEGVPCFIFGGSVALSGAQPPEALAQAIEQAAAEYSGRVAAE